LLALSAEDTGLVVGGGVLATAAVAFTVTTMRRRRAYLARLRGDTGDVTLEVRDRGTAQPPINDSVLRRTPHLDFSAEEPFAPGTSFEVVVFADIRPPRPEELVRPIEITILPNVPQVTLAVWLSVSEHFELIDKEVKSLMIDVNEERTINVPFQVKVIAHPPISGPPPAISAHFWFKGSACGSVGRVVKLGGLNRLRSAKRARRKAKLPPQRIEASTLSSEADLTVHVTAASRAETNRFTCVVSTNLLEERKEPSQQEWRLERATGELVREMMEDFTDETTTGAQLANRLRSAGKDLFKVSPDVFQAVFRELIESQADLRSIRIVSQEPFIPWELMVPNWEDYDSGYPLGVAYAVGRWIDNPISPAEQVILGDCRVVAPEYRTHIPLQHAKDEAKFVLRLFHGAPVVPPTWTGLDRTFAKGGASLFHFICHGSKDGRSILLGPEVAKQADGNLRVSDLKDWPNAKRAFQERRPLVFLNACEVGRLRPSLLGIEGLASSFARLGASCVIAPIWSVDDNDAHEVAKRFYLALSENPGQPLASFLQGIRQTAYGGTGSDTFAAYCFFGDPLTTAEIAIKLGQ